jgi:cardiolipin synthase
MYVLWGKSDSKRKIEKKVLQKLRHGATFYEYNQETMEEFATKYPTKARMVKFLESYSFPLYQNNQIDYYPMGEETFDAIIRDMEKAEKFIMVNFFIIGEGVLWDRIHSLLIKKIQEGVEVMFMYDDFGAMLRTGKGFRRMLELEGFRVRVFNPIHKYTDKLYMNYRSHQKIIVVDGNIGYTGGMNLADEYVNLVDRFGTWKDNAVRVEGEAVWGLTVTFLQMWEVCTDGTLIDYTPYRPTKVFEKNQVFCQVLSDGPANNPSNPVESFYKQMIHYSKRYLYVTTPYLVIEQDMQEALINAVRSGVDVRIITPKIPDKKSVKLVTNYNYGKLLEFGVRIFEYEPGFIHAKTIINEDCGVVGTINMDYRSFYLHYECGLFMCNPEVISKIKKDLDETLLICHEITFDEWKNRPWYLKLVQQCLNLFATIM